MTDVKLKICVIGLGYVGFPLAVSLAEHFRVVGYDIDPKRCEELNVGVDRNNEYENFLGSGIDFFAACDEEVMAGCDIFIITVPTPVTVTNEPDLSLIEAAVDSISRYLRKKCLVVLESTVFPGVTRKIVGEVLSNNTGLKVGKDFWLAYSPERIDPGNASASIKALGKVVSGCGAESLEITTAIYEKICPEVFVADSIEVAELSKLVENTQRDLNIGLMNELVSICQSLGLSTRKVLDVAESKWNFLRFTPGLVGGHCIGVDPYYLAYVARVNGIFPRLIDGARLTNDSMHIVVANRIVNELRKVGGRRVIILGLTFKENVNDFRNSKTFDLISELETRDLEVVCHDPHGFPENLVSKVKYVNNVDGSYDLGCLAVPHSFYLDLGITQLIHRTGVKTFLDIKGRFREQHDRLVTL